MAKSGIPISKIISTGGGAKSSLWTQIKSDITGQVIEVPENEEAPCLGAAIIGAVSEGFFPSYEDAVRECISIKKRYEPSCHEKYKKTYEVFENVYDALAGAYRDGMRSGGSRAKNIEEPQPFTAPSLKKPHPIIFRMRLIWV